MIKKELTLLKPIEVNTDSNLTLILESPDGEIITAKLYSYTSGLKWRVLKSVWKFPSRWLNFELVKKSKTPLSELVKGNLDETLSVWGQGVDWSYITITDEIIKGQNDQKTKS